MHYDKVPMIISIHNARYALLIKAWQRDLHRYRCNVPFSVDICISYSFKLHITCFNYLFNVTKNLWILVKTIVPLLLFCISKSWTNLKLFNLYCIILWKSKFFIKRSCYVFGWIEFCLKYEWIYTKQRQFSWKFPAGIQFQSSHVNVVRQRVQIDVWASESPSKKYI